MLLERFTAVVLLTDDEGSGDCWVFVRPERETRFRGVEIFLVTITHPSQRL